MSDHTAIVLGSKTITTSPTKIHWIALSVMNRFELLELLHTVTSLNRTPHKVGRTTQGAVAPSTPASHNCSVEHQRLKSGEHVLNWQPQAMYESLTTAVCDRLCCAIHADTPHTR